MAGATSTEQRDAPEVGGGGVNAFLYDADGDDREVTPERTLVEGLEDEDLLWIDVDSSEEGAIALVAGLLPLEPGVLEARPGARPYLRDYGDAFVLGVLPVPAARAGTASETLVCAVGRNWLVTLHEGDVGSIRDFADHLRGDSALGKLDAPSFLAHVLEWVINAYFDRLDELQQAIDEIEVSILRERTGEGLVERLVGLRHDVGQLRRQLSPHRQVLASLSHPSFDVISGSSAARDFEVLVDRLEMAVQTADTTREMIVGAFDVFMTQTAQHTNEIMRVLTTVSVLLLPATLIAGIFGMNMLPKDMLQPWVFWGALGLMLAIAAVLLLALRALFWRR